MNTGKIIALIFTAFACVETTIFCTMNVRKYEVTNADLKLPRVSAAECNGRIATKTDRIFTRDVFRYTDATMDLKRLLIVTGTDIKYFPRIALFMVNLIYLEILQTGIQSFEQGDFDDLSNIQLIRIIGNHLKSVDFGMLRHMTNIKTIDLYGNNIETVILNEETSFSPSVSTIAFLGNKCTNFLLKVIDLEFAEIAKHLLFCCINPSCCETRVQS